MSMISSLIDELNKSADEWNGSNMFELARMCREAADTIWELRDDLQRANAENAKLRELEAIADHIDRELVELPKDAHGEYIRVGDTLDGYGKTIEVAEMRYGRGGWVLISRDGNAYADCAAFAHHHAPTVEDVLEEFVARWMETHHDDIPALKAEYAAKLALRGDE